MGSEKTNVMLFLEITSELSRIRAGTQIKEKVDGKFREEA